MYGENVKAIIQQQMKDKSAVKSRLYMRNNSVLTTADLKQKLNIKSSQNFNFTSAASKESLDT